MKTEKCISSKNIASCRVSETNFVHLDSQNLNYITKMSLTNNLCCPFFGHNITRVKDNTSFKLECKCCESNIESSLNSNLEFLTDVQLEIKKTIRELFLLNHRRRRRNRALMLQ
jgi:hypothetical protein